jgi:pimeloyl-ACP methyl ester carboxylesterase
MRVQTGAGFSPYSTEVTVTTLQALPAGPTNLRATAISSSQVNLTWTNNALDAIAVRVESQPAGSASFTDVGPAVTLTSTGIANLQANTTYSFRVRAQNAAGYSAYSTTVSATTLALKATVFLIHGIGQDSTDMNSLAWSLGSPQSPDRLDLNRFQVDSGFGSSSSDWSHLCANNASCDRTTCTISNGAASLANYIASKNPPGEIILLGYSLGGLLARQLMVSSALPITAVATLGTPNVGYPYDPEDEKGFLGLGAMCPTLVEQMSSDWRTYQASNQVVESSFLLGLNSTWGATTVGRPPLKWLAIAGTFCGAAAGDQIRSIVGSGPNEGCPDKYPYSDGVVCQVSAWLSLAMPKNTPSDYYSDGTFAHADATLLCFWSKALGSYNVLYKPPMNSPLLAKIRSFLSALP